MTEPDVARPVSGRRARWSVASRAVRPAGKVAFSAVLLYIVLRDAPLAEVFRAIRAADWGLVLIAFSLSFLGHLISTSRWRLLLRAHGVRPSFAKLLQAYVVAIFFNNLLPSTVGGDAMRTYDSWRFGATKSAAVTVVLSDRILGVVALLLVALGGLAVPGRIADALPVLRIVVAGLLLVVGAAWLLVRVRRRLVPLADWWRRKLPDRLGEALSNFAAAGLLVTADRGLLARCLGLSLLLQLNVIVQFVVLGLALSLPIPPPHFFIIVPLSVLVMMLPITVNGIGIRENAFAFFFGFFGVPAATSVGFAWIAYGFLVAQAALGGLVYASRR